MIVEQGSQSDFLRALLKSPQFGLPDYSADPIVQRRVGRAIAELLTAPRRNPAGLLATILTELNRPRPSSSRARATFAGLIDSKMGDHDGLEPD
jgi:hypothetical protein